MWIESARLARALATSFAAALGLAVLATTSPGQDTEEALASLRAGDYEECLEAAELGLEEDSWNSSWHALKARALQAMGRYGEARLAVEAGIDRFSSNTQLRLLGHEVMLRAGNPERAEELLDEIQLLVKQNPWLHESSKGLITAGQVMLLRGADAKEVLDGYFRRALRERPDEVEATIAIARAALDKHDDALAATELQRALEVRPDDPDLHHLLATAFAEGDGERAQAAIERALELNPRHAASLLMVIDRQIDAEEYAEAEAGIAAVLAIEPGRWEAWAYRAVLAHLDGEDRVCEARRGAALASWKTNPGVDHLIGAKLSQKYRFAEGARYQRRALELDPDHAGARFQLAQDLLRLGQAEEGWRLAEQTLNEDEYNVVAYNLMTLHDRLAGYRTLERDGFVVRMESTEAEVYGPMVLDLLVRARDELAPKYEVELDGPVWVEIFAEQKDFAIRTFGLPGGAGFLGVCFGDVVTMNSPASQGATPSNWQAVLWHEYCHVLTLNKTANKMPRWLSEGISVYEERLADASWGQSMDPQWRSWVLSGRITPVSALSAAFLRPQGPMGLQFAYYQSSMVVEYLVETAGLPALLGVLDDLREGQWIHESLAARVAPADQLDAAFEAWLRGRAEALAPEVEWDVDAEQRPSELAALKSWTEEHPADLGGLILYGRTLIAEQRDEEAVAPLERALELYPGYVGGDCAYLALAELHARRGDTEREIEILERYVALEADAMPARLRLVELHGESGETEGLARALRRTLAVQPMLAEVQRARLRSARDRGEAAEVLQAGQALLALEPIDRAQVHFEMALAAEILGEDARARVEVLRALEEAPRFREAQRLLLRIVRPQAPGAAEGDDS